jgi:hypothetical protein
MAVVTMPMAVGEARKWGVGGPEYVMLPAPNLPRRVAGAVNARWQVRDAGNLRHGTSRLCRPSHHIQNVSRHKCKRIRGGKGTNAYGSWEGGDDRVRRRRQTKWMQPDPHHPRPLPCLARHWGFGNVYAQHVRCQK